MGHLKLLARDRLIKTGPVDHADWNYKSILGMIQRLRFKLALSLLPTKSHRLLEVGFGSGVFMPSLHAIADELYGVDIHDEAARVRDALARENLIVRLACSSGEAIPFESHVFDSAVAVSSLEFVADLPSTCAEIRRVLKTGGSFVVITPGTSPLIDLGLRVLTGKIAKEDFGDRRKLIIPTLLEYFRVEKALVFPPVGSGLICLYRAFKLSVPR